MADDKKKNVEEKKNDKAKTEAKSNSKSKKADKAAKGDIVTLDFDAWVINQDGTEELFETTSEELAKTEEIHDEKAKYRPLTTIVGAGRVVAGLDKSLEGAEVGKKTTVEIPPSEGDGDWDARKVEIFPMRDFAKEEYQPYPGLEVSIKNKTGRIVTVMSGRVRVDFNLPMAGKTVRYEYTITNKASNSAKYRKGKRKGKKGDFKSLPEPFKVLQQAQIEQESKKEIRKAFDTALVAHKDMRRKSGEPYI